MLHVGSMPAHESYSAFPANREPKRELYHCDVREFAHEVFVNKHVSREQY